MRVSGEIDSGTGGSAPACPAGAAARPRFAVVDGTRALPPALAGSVMLLGNFDGFHLGHRALLAQARRLAGPAPLSILSAEPHPRQFFAPHLPPFRLSTTRLKRRQFADAGFSFLFAPCFDHAFAGQSAETFVEELLVARLRVAHLVVGEDFRFGHARRGDAALLRAMGRELGFGVTVLAPLRRQELVCSSSLVRALLRQGEVRAAGELLGAPWRVEVERLPEDAPASGEEGLALGWPGDMLRLPDGRYAGRLVAADNGVSLATGRLALQAGRARFHPAHRLAGRSLPRRLALDILDA